MSYVEKNVVPGETLVYKTGCHWIVMFWPVVGGLVLGFFGFAFFAGGWLATRNGGRYQGAMVWGALALLGALALIASGVIGRFATEVVVSNRRVLIKTGCSLVEASKCCWQKWKVLGLTNLSWAGYSGSAV